jgi:hypothetical protein
VIALLLTLTREGHAVVLLYVSACSMTAGEDRTGAVSWRDVIGSWSK